MNSLRTRITTLIATRITAFACAAFVTASMLGGVNALAVGDAPAVQMAQQAEPSKG